MSLQLYDIEHGSITLRGSELPVRTGYVSQYELEFFTENPRIYTIVGAAAQEASQDEILQTMSGMEHVKQLVQSIKINGGLHDPVIVRGNVVLEGNSRLAAYRMLVQKDPVKWGRIKATLLPDDISDDLVFALLGEYHLIGKKDWAPFEQAGYLYRRHVVHGIPAKEISHEFSISTREVNHLIQTYKFMLDFNDNAIDRWSYYDQYLRIKNIAQKREEYPQLDSVFAAKVRSGDICKAVDVREKLKVILNSEKRIIYRFLSGEKNFEKCYEMAIEQGHGDGYYKRLHGFRNWIVDASVETEIHNMPPEVLNKCLFELGKINKRVEKILERLSGKL